jgi:hypothetical protein
MRRQSRPSGFSVPTPALRPSETRWAPVSYRSLPQITPATQLGAPFVEAYAKYAGLSVEAYLAQSGETLTAEQVAESVLDLTTDDGYGLRPTD